MPKIITFKAKLTKKKLNSTTWLFNFQPDQKIDFYAGQYVSIRIKEKVNRSYSISSMPGQSLLELLVDISPGGEGSQFLSNLEINQEALMMGPFGFFTLEKENLSANDTPLILIATGTGIAPFKSMILDQLVNKKSKRKIELLFGLRYEKEAYLFDEFTKLASTNNNFEFIPVISKPENTWKGQCGHCQDSLMQKPVNHEARIFICGRTAVCESISNDLINYGYKKDQILYEKYG